MKKPHIQLSDKERSGLKAKFATGALKARTFQRATALLELAAQAKKSS